MVVCALLRPTLVVVQHNDLIVLQNPQRLSNFLFLAIIWKQRRLFNGLPCLRLLCTEDSFSSTLDAALSHDSHKHLQLQEFHGLRSIPTNWHPSPIIGIYRGRHPSPWESTSHYTSCQPAPRARPFARIPRPQESVAC